ncbi:SKI complex RNA helicase subunit SKI2 [Aspergillus foveolatus]|uniref:SKI complex RNA helicase subunit SKI2 n=1 Tax=Aspergillus foveolatus TaxID=210207 RepID=UPI003CCE06CC
METLSSTLAQLDLGSQSIGGKAFDELIAAEENGTYQNRAPKRRARPSAAELRRDLENEFLTPSPQFSSEWLNRLQRRWDVSTDYTDLFEIADTQTRTIVRFDREGLEGRVTGYHEVTVPANSANAKNSTSLLRRPAGRADFVRGAAGFFPFAPGGLDGVEAIAEMEAEVQTAGPSGSAGKQAGLDRIINFGSEGGLLEVAPGLSRGLKFEEAKSEEAADDDEEVEQTLQEEESNINPDHDETASDVGGVKIEDEESASEDEEEDDIDALLPVEFPSLEPRAPLLSAFQKKGGKEWAHVVDVNKEIPNFHELVPDMAREWPFELDTFQKEAVYHLENGDSVFVAAHTSAGKTVVAEYAIALAAKHMTKAIYTSPIKALSNQKFRDFKNTFDDVGILTGDVQINPEASCLIMTTEILRSMLYRGADLIRDVEFVIFDEVHYVNDLERGVVWEEVIIMLPEHVTLILLSATVPNTQEFASWVGRTKKKDIYVISTAKRPVPLEHYLWAGKDKFKIVDSNKRFLESGWKQADDIISGKDKIKAQKAAEAQAQSQASRGGSQGRGRGQAPARGGPRGGGGGQRGGGQRGRGQPANRGTGNIARTGRGGGRTTAAQDKTVWVQVVQHLRKENLLPACIFVFSKKRCEQNADSLSNQDFCNASEKSLIHITIEKSLTRLKQEDRTLPQILRLRELLGRGIAVHHGGLLPIMKEIVEILFAKTLVKVLFATETFAMGLNLPTRTVVFSGFRKHDGKGFRDLLPGEYTQMAGRAGRRGLDNVGYVIVVNSGKDEAPPAGALRKMILGDPTKLRSQFRLTYNMILNLLRVEALKIEEMIKRSFSENATQALLPEHEKQVQISEASLEKIKREPCGICDVDLAACHDASIEYGKLTSELHLNLLSSPVGKRLLMPKRLVVYRKDGYRTAGVIVREVGGGPNPVIQILEIGKLNSKRHPSEILPFLPAFRGFLNPLPTRAADMTLKVFKIPIADIECVTNTIVKLSGPTWYLNIKKEAIRFADKELSKLCSSWTTPVWDELDWARIKELQLRDILDKRREQANIAQSCDCLKCPKFLKHFEMQRDEWQIKENISQLKQLMSDQNLQLLPDYEQRIQVLKDLGFVDEQSRVQLKGKVACEIHSADELVLTELILENVLAEYEPEEIVALLSAFVFQEKTENVPTLTPRLEKGKEAIIRISEKVNDVQIQHQVLQSTEDINDFASQPRFGLAEVVYEWAKGMSFNRITDLTDVMEGTIMDVAALRNRIQSTLDANADIRRQAELDLKYAETQPGFINALLDILQGEQVNAVQLSAGVYLKNRINRGWSTIEDSPLRAPIAEEEKPGFRERLIPALVSTPPNVRAQLVPLLQKILQHDFPEQWPGFLDITMQLLGTNDAGSVYAGLQCLLAICRVYRFKAGDKREEFDKIIEHSFPQLLSIGSRLVDEESVEAAEMLRIVVKSYKHAIYFELSPHLQSHQATVDWCTLFLRIIAKEPPANSMMESKEERELAHWWKCKKWAYANLNRLFIRYGNPTTIPKSSNPDYSQFAKSFITTFAPEILKGYLQEIDKYVSKGQWLSNPALSYTLIFFEECVKPKSMWDHLKPHMENLIAHFVFPILCQSDEDIELFETDPSEYLHRKLNYYEEVSAPDVAATNFLITLTKNRKKQTFSILTFVNGIVSKYEAAPDDQKLPREKEGALRMIGSLASVILGKKSPIADQVEYFFVRHVFPEFRSPHGFLRARACDTLEKFEQLDFQDPNNLMIIYRNILESMTDSELPVRVEAALALQPLIRHDVIRTSMQQNIPQIMQQLLKLANEVDVDALANVMEDFVEVFSAELTPFAVALSEQLRDTYMRIVGELLERNAAKGEEDTYGDFLDDKSITALGVLQTIGTLILTLESTPDVLLHLETVLMPVISITLENKLYDLYNEVFEIIDSCTFASKSISPTMWQAFELIHKTFKAGAELYLEDMLPALDNYVAYGSQTLVQNPAYLAAIVGMVEDIFNDEKVGGVDRICGCKLAETVMLNLRGYVDQYIPVFIELAMRVIDAGEARTKSCRLHLMEMVINAIYYNPVLSLQVLEAKGWTNKFFSAWFSSIDSFRRVHDKTLSIVAITSLLTLNPADVPTSVQQGWPRLLQGVTRLFHTLPAAIQNRQEATKESDFQYEEEDEDDEGNDWEGEVEWTEGDDEAGPEGDIPDESAAYLDFLNKEAQKFGSFAGDDDDDELDEESLLETPLDKVEPYGLFKQVFMNLQQQQPQLYENLTNILNDEEKKIIESVFHEADAKALAAANEEAAKAAALQANGNQ